MVALLIFLIIMVFVFCYLLFAPLFIEIDSRTGSFGMRFHRLMSMKLFIKEPTMILEIKIIGWRKQIDLLANRKANGKSFKRKIKTSKQINSTKQSIPLKKLIAIIKSFKVNKFYLSVCFDNMYLNGIFYPIVNYLSVNKRRNMKINFINENEMVLEIENNFYRIIRAYINS